MHQPQARDTHTHACFSPPPSHLLSPLVPQAASLHPCSLSLTLSVFLLRCFTCAFTLSLSVALSLFFLSRHSISTHFTSSLFHSLFLYVPALHLTQRESSSHKLTLPLGFACDCSPLSAQSRFPPATPTWEKQKLSLLLLHISL